MKINLACIRLLKQDGVMRTEKNIKAGERTQHTPGPWRIANPNRQFGVVIVSDTSTGTQIHVASTIGITAEDHDIEAEANARLISAAPDLLDAAKRLLEINAIQSVRIYANANGITTHANDMVEAMLAAIAKAEGTAQ